MIDRIKNSEVVILWGIDESVNSFSEHIDDKTIIVIDSKETDLAMKSDLHIHIKENGDIFFAVMLCRFLFISDMVDEDFLNESAIDFEDFYDFTQEFRIVLTLNKIDLDTSKIRSVLELITDKKLLIICGNGIGKFEELDEFKDVLTSFGMLLGLHRKEGCGILHVDSQGHKEFFDFDSDNFEFIDEIDTDMLK